MTTDKELADKVVALGIGELVLEGSPDQTKMFRSPRSYALNNDFPFYTEEFVRDWRVAGALIEKCQGGIESLVALNSLDYLPKDASLVREIIEACVLRLGAVSDTKG